MHNNEPDAQLHKGTNAQLPDAKCTNAQLPNAQLPNCQMHNCRMPIGNWKLNRCVLTGTKRWLDKTHGWWPCSWDRSLLWCDMTAVTPVQMTASTSSQVKSNDAFHRMPNRQKCQMPNAKCQCQKQNRKSLSKFEYIEICESQCQSQVASAQDKMPNAKYWMPNTKPST